MSKEINPANLLIDLQNELNGFLLEDTVTVYNHKYTIRLLTEEETIWTYGFLNPKNAISIAVASRLASLAIGLRSIDGISVDEVFKPVWEKLEPEKQAEMLGEHKEYSMVIAKLVMDWLRKQSNHFVNKLHEAWQALEERRLEAQEEVKNLSGGDSEKVENPNMTESSQHGER